MRVPPRLLAPTLLLPLLLTMLAACGDDQGSSSPFEGGTKNPFGTGADNPFGGDPSKPFGIDPNDPKAGEKIYEGMMKSVQEIELTDANLAKLYEAAKEMKAVGDDPAKGFALVRKRGWDWVAYGKAMIRFEQLRRLARRGEERFARDMASYEKRLARMKEQIAKAEGPQKQALEQSLSMLEKAHEAEKRGSQDLEKLRDPAYRKMIEDWGNKFDALDE